MKYIVFLQSEYDAPYKQRYSLDEKVKECITELKEKYGVFAYALYRNFLLKEFDNELEAKTFAANSKWMHARAVDWDNKQGSYFDNLVNTRVKRMGTKQAMVLEHNKALRNLMNYIRETFPQEELWECTPCELSNGEHMYWFYQVEISEAEKDKFKKACDDSGFDCYLYRPDDVNYFLGRVSISDFISEYLVENGLVGC